MQTQCNEEQLLFQDLGMKKIIVDRQAEIASSDGGLLFLREIERKYHVIGGLLEHFRDYRNQKYVIHSLQGLLSQRIFGMVQGYEDINDHDQWRMDPLLMTACDLDPATHIGAGKSTLNRLESLPLNRKEYNRYRKFDWREQGIKEHLIEISLDTFRKAPKEIILDMDTTDFILNGNQEGKHFSGFYDEYCYQPLYIFAGELLLCADLLTGDTDHTPHALTALKLVIEKIRKRWKKTKIIVRGDGGFCRDSLMSLCEETPRCYYVFGLPKNTRLCKIIGASLDRVGKQFQKEKVPQREFSEFSYMTRKSWKRARRVIAKAEYLEKGKNPRFIVTNLTDTCWNPQKLYEKLYCARGNMENRIKEQKLDMFSDRVSTHYLRSNQLRLLMTCFAYFFAMIIRQQGLCNTALCAATFSTIRLRIMKVAVLVRVSVRRIKISLPKSYPYWDDWISLHTNLEAI